MENTKFHFREDILVATYKQKLEVDLETAKQLVADRLTFQNRKECPVVIYMNGIKASSKEARIYMGKEGIQGITIGAFVVRNTIEQVILNFFLSIEKPPVPAKAFTSEEDAVSWIREIQKKHSIA